MPESQVHNCGNSVGNSTKTSGLLWSQHVSAAIVVEVEAAIVLAAEVAIVLAAVPVAEVVPVAAIVVARLQWAMPQ